MRPKSNININDLFTWSRAFVFDVAFRITNYYIFAVWMSISYQYSKWKTTLERHRTAKGNSINSYAIETSDFLNVQMISSDSKQRQWKNEANVITNIEQRTDTTWTVHELTGKSRKLSTISIEVTLEKNGRKAKKS